MAFVTLNIIALSTILYFTTSTPHNTVQATTRLLFFVYIAVASVQLLL
jgi:hypothetical protein